jgi:hypothetical protein
MKKYSFLVLVLIAATLWALLLAPSEMQYFVIAVAASVAIGAVLMRIIGYLDGWC